MWRDRRPQSGRSSQRTARRSGYQLQPAGQLFHILRDCLRKNDNRCVFITVCPRSLVQFHSYSSLYTNGQDLLDMQYL